VGGYHAGGIWNDAFSQYIRGGVIFWKLEHATAKHRCPSVSRMDKRNTEYANVNSLGYFLAYKQSIAFCRNTNMGAMDVSSPQG
jgi:hypothetical protein